MKKKLSELLIELYNAKKTGQLTLPIYGENHHLKIFLCDGNVYHLACGKVYGMDCLQLLRAASIRECFFIPNLKTSMTQTNLPPTTLLVQQMEHIFIELNTAISDTHKASTIPSLSSQQASSALSAHQRLSSLEDSLKTALMKQVGPIGSKIMARIITQWLTSPHANNYEVLITLLSEQIDDPENRNIFLKEAENLLQTNSNT